MIIPAGTPQTSLLRVLFLGLSTFASFALDQLEMEVSTGFNKLEAVEGEEVVLPAWYTLPREESSSQPWEVPLLFWYLEHEGKDLKQVLSYINGVVSSNPRVSLVHSVSTRNVSLRLEALQEEDSGTYRCSVNVQDDGSTTMYHGSKSIELKVLVPPAPPSCSFQGVPYVGTNVTLNCKSPRSKPTAQYQWEKLAPSPQVFFGPALDAIRGSLKLTNLSTSMSGVYVCKAQNRVGFTRCNVTLEVMTGSKAAVVAGAVVGTLVGLVLLAGLVLLYQRRNKTLEELANDIKEDAIAPRTLPWTKGSDTISKNGTLSSVTSARALRPPKAVPPRPGTFTPTPSVSSQALSSPRLPRTDGPPPQPVSLAPGLAVEVTVPTEPLSVPKGKTAELSCRYSTSVGDNFALEWSFVPPGKPISASLPILYFTNNHLYPTGSKADRASLLHSPPTAGVATLKLTDLRPSDTGTYLCNVNNPPDFYTNGLGLINLTVLDEVSGQLILTNLSLTSSGTYRCVASNQMGSASCELNLSVTDSSEGRVAGTLIGVLLGVLLLSVAAFCLIRFQKERKKEPKETYGGSDLREDATAPGVSEQASMRADYSKRLLEKVPSDSTVTTKSKLSMVV
ncbi:endothelial cell-selective adhesion molecule-like protein [Cricetulus griseus]|nr:endothelial cell-selective adhesion molecule-like protein [Cricetulus griseus]